MNQPQEIAAGIAAFAAAIWLSGLAIRWCMHWCDRRDQDYQRRQAALRAHKSHLYPGTDSPRWPDECSDPPCSHEDYWVCTAHRLAGKHRLGNTPLDDQPAHVIARVITDAQNRKRP